MKNVVGIDIDFKAQKSNLIINHQNDKYVSIDNCVDEIISKSCILIPKKVYDQLKNYD